MRMETDYNDFFVISREETDEQVSKALVFIEYIEVVIAGLQVPAQNNWSDWINRKRTASPFAGSFLFWFAKVFEITQRWIILN